MYCCVKNFMHDLELQQAPECAIPGGRLGDMTSSTPQTVVPRHTFGQQEVTDYLKLTTVCEDMGLHHGVDELNRLLH